MTNVTQQINLIYLFLFYTFTKRNYMCAYFNLFHILYRQHLVPSIRAQDNDVPPIQVFRPIKNVLN